MARKVELTPVSEHMRTAFISVEPTESCLQAAQMMQLARIRHVPVLSLDGALVGIVSHRDLMEASLSPHTATTAGERFQALRPVPVGAIMHTALWTLSPESTLADAAELMLRHKIGCVPIVAEKEQPLGLRMVGLITESDLLAAAYLPERDARTLGDRA